MTKQVAYTIHHPTNPSVSRVKKEQGGRGRWEKKGEREKGGERMDIENEGKKTFGVGDGSWT